MGWYNFEYGFHLILGLYSTVFAVIVKIGSVGEKLFILEVIMPNNDLVKKIETENQKRNFNEINNSIYRTTSF